MKAPHTLPLPTYIRPRQIMDIERGLKRHWGPKIQENMQWSDPIRAEEFNSFVTKTEEVISDTILKERQLEMYEQQ